MRLESTDAADRRYAKAQANKEEAKADTWRSIASIVNLLYIAMILAAIVFLIVGTLELTPWF
jgi:hypothetical protein